MARRRRRLQMLPVHMQSADALPKAVFQDVAPVLKALQQSRPQPEGLQRHGMHAGSHHRERPPMRDLENGSSPPYRKGRQGAGYASSWRAQAVAGVRS